MGGICPPLPGQPNPRVRLAGPAAQGRKFPGRRPMGNTALAVQWLREELDGKNTPSLLGRGWPLTCGSRKSAPRGRQSVPPDTDCQENFPRRQGGGPDGAGIGRQAQSPAPTDPSDLEGRSGLAFIITTRTFLFAKANF